MSKSVVVLFISLISIFYLLYLKELPDKATVTDFMRRLGLPALTAILFLILGTTVFLSPLSGFFLGVLGWYLARYMDYLILKTLKKKIRAMAMDFITSAKAMFGQGLMPVVVIGKVSERMPEPLNSDFKVMLGSITLLDSITIAKLFDNLYKKYDVSEFHAIGKIVSTGQSIGGPPMIARGLSQLGVALRRRAKRLMERAAGLSEAVMGAWIIILIQATVAIIDVTIFRKYFTDALLARTVLGIGMGMMSFMIFIVLRTIKNNDLEV